MHSYGTDTRIKNGLKREEGRTIGAVKEIAALLGMERIMRMEAYDISNTNGFESVGSMIVYENGKPKRNDYRKFKIKTCKRDRMIMRVCGKSLHRRFTAWTERKRRTEEKRRRFSAWQFYCFPGSDPDGWRQRAG